MGLYEIPPDNTPVSRYELGLALAPLRSDIGDLKLHAASKADVRSLDANVTELGADVKAWKMLAERRAWLGGRGRALINAVLVSGAASLVGALIVLFVGGHR